MKTKKKGFTVEFKIYDETDRAIDRNKISLDDLYNRLTEKYGYRKKWPKK